jgi:hypothetical protein
MPCYHCKGDDQNAGDHAKLDHPFILRDLLMDR